MTKKTKVQCPYCLAWVNLSIGAAKPCHCSDCKRQIFFASLELYNDKFDGYPTYQLVTLKHEQAEEYYQCEIPLVKGKYKPNNEDMQ